MRSTEGLRPKIGRVVPPAGKMQAQPQVRASRVGMSRVQALRPAEGELEPTLQPPPQSVEGEQVQSRGLKNQSRAKNVKPPSADPERDIDWDKIISISKFMVLPAIFAVLIVIVGIKLPKVALYGVAASIGVAAMLRAQRDPEILLALMLIYIPFAHLYSISLAPLVNGTNIFIIICLFAGISAANSRGESAFEPKPGFKIAVAWFALSSLSVLTLARTPGALSFTLGNELTQYTAWLGHMGFYLAVYSLIKTPGQAKRAMIYLMFGTVIVVMFGAREMIGKIGLSSIEKQRLGGVFQQPNDFGGFIAYTFIPFIALFLFNMGKIKSWVMVPYFLVTLKVLITTFSRGAYVAFVAGGLIIGWLRGKAFLIGWGIFALALVVAFPQVLPDSVLDRLNQSGRSSKVEKLDKSSSDRLILWNAAIEMTLENPITGKGFKAFPYLKAQYTDIPVRESDPHSMYLYISSQMGIPTLLVFLAMMTHTGWIGLSIFKRSDDKFEKIIGASIASVVPCLVLVNIFGSRMVNTSFVSYFYTMVVIAQVLSASLTASKKSARLKSNASEDIDGVAGQEMPVPKSTKIGTATVGAHAVTDSPASNLTARRIGRV